MSRATAIAVKLRIETPSVQEQSSGSSEEYKPRYRFPFIYGVLDTAGNRLAEQEIAIAWDGSTPKLTQDEQTTSTGSTLTVEHRLEKFPVPAGGEIVIEARLQPDTRYRARAREAKLLVYDNQVLETWPVATWIAMLASGLVLAVVGFVFAVSSMASAPAPVGQGGAASAAAASQSARRYAVLCHLAGLLGYVIPLGNVFGALAAWLLWRDTDAFVADQGKEALNFQLSVTLYFVASAVLVFVIIGIFLLLALAVFHFALMIVAAAAAASGKAFRYPLTFRIVK